MSGGGATRNTGGSSTAPRADTRPPGGGLSAGDYERLAELRHALRRFLHWSAERAKSAGLTPTQHQLMLAIRASTDERGPAVGDVADTLLIRHHSAVGLVDRARDAGLIGRRRDPEQPSVVRLYLTDYGAAKLASLSELHLRELKQLAPGMRALWEALEEPAPDPRHATAREPEHRPQA